MRGFGKVASIGVHLSDRSAGRVGLAGDGALRLSYRLSRRGRETIQFGIARAAEIHFAAGATEVYPNVGRVGDPRRGKLADFEARRTRSPPTCGSRRSTRWGPRGWAPTRTRASPTPTAPSAASSGLYVADASLLPDLGRRQPDDDDHRLRLRIAAGWPAASAAAGLSALGTWSRQRRHARRDPRRSIAGQVAADLRSAPLPGAIEHVGRDGTADRPEQESQHGERRTEPRGRRWPPSGRDQRPVATITR